MVERVTISLPRLPEAFDGTTVAAIADLHGGRRLGGAGAVKKIVEMVNSLQADVIVLLGDMVHRAHHATRYLPLLSELKAKVGIWAALGNHEHGFVWYSRFFGRWPVPSAEQWRAMYAQLGMSLLVNEAQPLHKGGARIWLIGVDDAYSGCDDLPAALQCVEGAEFSLAITHSPDLIDHPRIAEVDLVLAGHTHGGQVRLPLLGPLYVPCRRPRERSAGLIRANNSTMYVTRGVGEGLPFRFCCNRELSLLTLRK